MKAIHNILFATDFSELAQNAFRYALYFAKKTGAKIEVIHVVMPEYEALDLPVMAMQATQQRLEAAKEVMKDFVAQGLTYLKTLNGSSAVPAIDTTIEIGGVADTIISTARQNETDLIMLGTHGTHNRFEKLFGSVAAMVVATAPCHVLVVPEKLRHMEVKMVAVATDLHASDPFNIWNTAKLLTPFNPVLYCVHIEGEKMAGQLAMQDLQDFFANNAPSLQINFHEIGGKTIPDMLSEFVENYEIDLLVMPSPHRAIFERLFHKSLTRKMAFYAQVPLFIFRE